MKKPYLAANIRAGYTAQRAAAWLTVNYPPMDLNSFRVDVTTFNHGRDACGNGTAHYRAQLLCTGPDGQEFRALTIVESGARREQVGYSGQNGAALYALSKLGFEVDTSKAGSYDYQDNAVYTLLNFPPKAVQS
jgi:hypothetical protein